MRLDDRAVDEHILKVELVRQHIENTFENTLDSPAAEPFEHAVPFAEALRKVAPRRSRADPPEHGPGKLSVVRRGDAGIGRLAGQHGLDTRPHGVGQHRPVCVHLSFCSFACAAVPAVVGADYAINPPESQPDCQQALIPCFQSSDSVDCMVGYFSSTVLSELAPGLAAFIANTEETFRLIVSPFLSEEDKKAIEEGARSVEEIAQNLLNEFFVTEVAMERHAVRCLSYLLRMGRIDIRVAIMRDALFHPKVWIFERGAEALAAHGSSNLTRSGIRKNFEQINVSRSWEDGTQSYIVEKFKYQFERLWADHEDDCVVVDLPKAVKDDLLRAYGSGSPPSLDEFIALYKEAIGSPGPIFYSSVETGHPPKARIRYSRLAAL